MLTPGETLMADRAYHTDAIGGLAAACGAWAHIPPRLIRKDGFASSGGVYRHRNCIAARHDRRLENFLDAIKLVATGIWRTRHQITT